MTIDVVKYTAIQVGEDADEHALIHTGVRHRGGVDRADDDAIRIADEGGVGKRRAEGRISWAVDSDGRPALPWNPRAWHRSPPAQKAIDH